MARERREFNERERDLIERVRTEIRRLLEELDAFVAENRNEFREFEEEGISNPVTDLRYVLTSLLEAFQEFVENPDSEKALQTLMGLSVLTGQVETMTSQLELLSISSRVKGAIQNAAATIANKVAGWFGYLKNAIQSISAKLWSLMSPYMNLKEWSIKGALGTSPLVSLFGMTASAELQLTFQK
jgi:hypothetical protein